MKTQITRRSFLKSMVIGGVSVYIATPFTPAFAALFEDKILQAPDWNPKTDTIKHRIDALAKAMGEKVFSMDIRSKDMPHWPQKQAHAMLLRVTEADKIYEGFDLSILEDGMMPDRIVTAKDLEKDNISFPEFFGEDMLLPEGKTPQYLGQAVALLIFNDFAKFKFAKNALQFNKNIIRWGKTTGFIERNPWSTYRGVRIGAKNPLDPDIYSSLKDVTISPTAFKKFLPVWPEGKEGGKLDQEGIYYADQLIKELDNPPEDWLVLDRTYHSQSIDTSSLEPNNSNGWYDEANQALHLVVATQSPMEVTDSILEMINRSNFKLKKLFLHPCFTVGYGSKDHAPEPCYGTLATLYSNGQPVRLANDRYEQFQSALKRHAFDMDFKIAINKRTHKIESLVAKFVGNGGGRCNFTPSVMAVGATGMQGIYYIPKSDLTAIGLATRAVDAGSARGYGTLQAMPALDTLLDEAARILKADPIEFRLNNLMKSGMKNTQGAIPGGMMRGEEVLKHCAEHEIWKEREKRKAEFEIKNPGKIFATGISCVQKDYGTGQEAAFARIELSPEGKVSFWHSGIEIGTGMSTSQSVLLAHYLGQPADTSSFGITEWPLELHTTEASQTLTQELQDELETDPHWTPALTSASSASNSAYFFSHVTTESARVLFDQGIWPAAYAIWSEGIGGGQAASLTVRREDARWTANGLTANGLEPLSLERIAKKVYEMGGLTGVVGHGFNRWQWAKAGFEFRNGNRETYDLDALALRWGKSDSYGFGHRISIEYPQIQRSNAGVTYYAAVATSVELAIDRGNGNIDLLNHHSVIECGNVIVSELVSGQIQGGIAMGIGHALHEFLPLYEDGPGNGTWNFNRYKLPLAKDVAVWKQTSEVLPALSETDPPKGMAEVTMIPVVSAITNAIADATGHYFNKHPILPKDILEVLA